MAVTKSLKSSMAGGVAAALALFASVALLFWYVLHVLMALTGRD